MYIYVHSTHAISIYIYIYTHTCVYVCVCLHVHIESHMIFHKPHLSGDIPHFGVSLRLGKSQVAPGLTGDRAFHNWWVAPKWMV